MVTIAIVGVGNPPSNVVKKLLEEYEDCEVIEVNSATDTDYYGETDYYSFGSYVNDLTRFADFCTSAWNDFAIWYNKSLLMYKGWITEKQYLRYLYIQAMKRKRKVLEAYSKRILKRKTVKGLSPIKRNTPGGRK